MPRIQRFHASIRQWLVAMVVLAVLPMLVFSGYAVHRLGVKYQDYVMANLDRRGESISHAVSERIQLTVSALNALASSAAAIRKDWATLHQDAVRLTKTDSSFRAITLVDSDDRMLLFTLAEYGGALPPVGQLDMHHRLLQSGMPTTSGPFKSPISSSIVAAVGVPVFQDGKPAYGLRMILLTDSLNRLLANQSLPKDWIAAIVASDGRLLARTHQPQAFVGQLAAPGLVAALGRGGKQSFVGRTKEGIATQTVTYPIAGTDWSVALGIPLDSLNGPLQSEMYRVYGLGTVLLILTVATVYAFARGIERDVSDLVQFGLDRGDKTNRRRYRISELARTDAHLRDLRRRESGAQAALNAAHNDGLTGLLGRVRFEVDMEKLLAGLKGQQEAQLALFFIDIDNFKHVNDSLGHAQGDAVLKQIADVLRSAAQDTDVVARLGGDEFAMCITGGIALEANARATAERVILAIGAIGHSIGASIGIVMCSQNCLDLPRLLDLADQAMYDAKRGGKNRYSLIRRDVTEV